MNETLNLIWSLERSTTGTERLLLVRLADLTREDGACRVAVASLARAVNTTDRSVYRALANLTAKGLLAIEHHLGHASVFHVLTPDMAVTPDAHITPDAVVRGPLTPVSQTPDASVTHYPINLIDPITETKKPKAKRRPKTATRNEIALAIVADFYAKTGSSNIAGKDAAVHHVENLLKRNGTTPDELRRAVDNYAAHVQGNGTEAKYVKAARNFFGREAVWRDFLEVSPAIVSPLFTHRDPTPEELAMIEGGAQ